MQLLNHHSKNAMLAVLIAATGLPASGALARFRAEYGSETRAAAEARQSEGDKDTRRTITITSDDKEHKYEVKIVNGELKLARLDGKELGSERVKITAEAVVFLDEDGEKLHEFRLPAPPAVPDAPRLPRGSAMIEMRDDEGRTFVTRGDIQINRPRVMLGVNMSEPSAALRKQLKLDEGTEVILIERVIDGLPADKAGLEEFDVIVSIDGSEGAGVGLLTSTLAQKNPDDRLDLVVLRGGEKLRLTAKLAEYDPEKLGGSAGAPPSPSDIERDVFRFDFSGDGEFDIGDHGREMRDLAREEILKSLQESGLDEEQLRALESRLDESLKALEEGVREAQSAHVLRLAPEAMGHGGHAGSQDGHGGAGHQHELAKSLRDKARQAMRDAERQIMEFRDGRLFVRSAEEVERRGDELRSRLERVMPDQQEIQSHMSELESRLAELESRLESQMSRFEHRLEEHFERLADRFERLMERLEENRE